jgi:hypothetical protein
MHMNQRQAINSTARQALWRASHVRMRRLTSSGRSCCTKWEQSSNTCSSRSDTYFSVPCNSHVLTMRGTPAHQSPLQNLWMAGADARPLRLEQLETPYLQQGQTQRRVAVCIQHQSWDADSCFQRRLRPAVQRHLRIRSELTCTSVRYVQEQHLCLWIIAVVQCTCGRSRCQRRRASCYREDCGTAPASAAT